MKRSQGYEANSKGQLLLVPGCHSDQRRKPDPVQVTVNQQLSESEKRKIKGKGYKINRKSGKSHFLEYVFLLFFNNGIWR